MRRLAMVLSAFALLACTKQEPTDAEKLAKSCDKLLALGKGPPTPAVRDRCLVELGVLGPNMRACADDCLAKATTEAAFKACMASACKGEGGGAR